MKSIDLTNDERSTLDRRACLRAEGVSPTEVDKAMASLDESLRGIERADKDLAAALASGAESPLRSMIGEFKKARRQAECGIEISIAFRYARLLPNLPPMDLLDEMKRRMIYGETKHGAVDGFSAQTFEDLMVEFLRNRKAISLREMINAAEQLASADADYKRCVRGKHLVLRRRVPGRKVPDYELARITALEKLSRVIVNGEDPVGIEAAKSAVSNSPPLLHNETFPLGSPLVRVTVRGDTTLTAEYLTEEAARKVAAVLFDAEEKAAAIACCERQDAEADRKAGLHSA